MFGPLVEVTGYAAVLLSWLLGVLSIKFFLLFLTVAILLTVFAQGLFLINFLWSLFRGEKVAEYNPWCATTLEWSVSSPPPADDFGVTVPVVYRGAYEFSVPEAAEDFVPQHLAPEQVVKARKSGE